MCLRKAESSVPEKGRFQCARVRQMSGPEKGRGGRLTKTEMSIYARTKGLFSWEDVSMDKASIRINYSKVWMQHKISCYYPTSYSAEAGRKTKLRLDLLPHQGLRLEGRPERKTKQGLDGRKFCYNQT